MEKYMEPTKDEIEMSFIASCIESVANRLNLDYRDVFDVKSMMKTPVIVMVLEGKDVVSVVRAMVGATNCRAAAPGTIRGDFGMSGQDVLFSRYLEISYISSLCMCTRVHMCAFACACRCRR